VNEVAVDLHEVTECVVDAVRELLLDEPTLFDFTSETNYTEWNIAHHLAIQLAYLFEDDGYDCDIDVLKVNLDNVRPDIIIHTRGTQERNLLVVEVKRNEADLEADIWKIQDNFFGRRLNYQFGAAVAIEKGVEPVIRVFENDSYQRNRSNQL
jgi:hypothetical protein